MRTLLCCCLMLLACRSAAAQCCDHCGCQSRCRKVCRVVCEVKKVPKITYGCECEEVCIPGPSQRTTVCDDCGNKRHIYTPTCGRVKTCTKMVKKVTFEEKVTYRWVVERLCEGCQSRCAQPDQTARGESARGAANRFPSADRIPSTAEASPALLTEYQQPPPPKDARGVPDASRDGENSAEHGGKLFDLNRILRPLRD